jgi:hypothetical protein
MITPMVECTRTIVNINSEIQIRSVWLLLINMPANGGKHVGGNVLFFNKISCSYTLHILR